MHKLFTRQWIGVLTILGLFIIEALFIIVGNLLLGFPTFDNGNPIIIVQIVILCFIALLWGGTVKSNKTPFYPTIYGILGLLMSITFVGEWIIFNGIFLLLAGIFLIIFLNTKISSDLLNPTLQSDNGIPSDDSRYIPAAVKQAVWIRDGGQCVLCKSKRQLEYDHNIPFSKGGSNTENNIRILCKECNRKKKDKIE